MLEENNSIIEKQFENKYKKIHTDLNKLNDIQVNK